jgi:GABA(A) receptor-associated protein
MKFKQEFSFEQRKDESSRVLNKYPDRVPIICEKSKTASSDCPDIDKKKYLVPRDLNMGQFLYVIRKRLRLSSEKALFLFVNNSITSSTTSINDIYFNHKDFDGFLYVTYGLENVFG